MMVRCYSDRQNTAILDLLLVPELRSSQTGFEAKETWSLEINRLGKTIFECHLEGNVIENYLNLFVG